MSAPQTKDCIGYDVATALWQGARAYQEDTLLADFHGGLSRGFAVLADGMGGHAAGDLASRLVVIDAVSHLKFLMHDGASLEANLHAELTSAITTANEVLNDRASDDSRLSGMGATFLATVMFEDRLYWASVGDSPLYLWREGKLRQINEDHSMAPVIDQMASAGEISAEDAANHPDRNALTSVLMGSRIKTMDVPKVATVLDPGDVLIQASDGLQYLDETAISAVLDTAPAGASSRVIAHLLMQALRDLDDPLQDNTALLVLQLCDGMAPGGGAVVGAPVSQRAAAAAPSAATTRAETTPSPRGSRRWIAPTALAGAVALGLGLIFGLPDGETANELAVAPPPPLAEPTQIAGAGAQSDEEEAAVLDVEIATGVPTSSAPAVTQPAAGATIAIADGEETATPEPDETTIASAPVEAEVQIAGDAPVQQGAATATIVFQEGALTQEPAAGGQATGIGIGLFQGEAPATALGTVGGSGSTDAPADSGLTAIAPTIANPAPADASLLPAQDSDPDAGLADDAVTPDPSTVAVDLPDPQSEDRPLNPVPGVGPLSEGLNAPGIVPVPAPRTPRLLPPAAPQEVTPGVLQSQRALVKIANTSSDALGRERQDP